MEQDPIGKDDLELTAPTEVARRRSKPTLMNVGTRVVTSDGRYHAPLVAEYLMDRARKNWIGVADLSKVFGGGNTIDGKRRVRKNMFSVFTVLLNRGEFLVYETLKNGRIHAVKLLDVSSDAEKQAARPQLERMKQRHQISSAKYEKALAVICLHEHLV